MSSPSKTLVCHWRASPLSKAVYGALWLLAVLAIALAEVGLGWQMLCWGICALHAYWTVPRAITLTHPTAISGIKCEHNLWFVYSHASGWQRFALSKSSVALPWLILVSGRVKGRLLPIGICLTRDALSADEHRRLRVRLKFSRQRWLALK